MLTSQHTDIAIKDIVVTSTVKDFKSPSNKSKAQAGELLIGNENEPSEKLRERLLEHIKNLAESVLTLTSEESKKNPHLVVRLITNEFFFFTKKPLAIEEFQMLMQSIANLSKVFPNSLHLILGSFAVLKNNVVMNVTPHIQCGKVPKIDLIVKNYPSEMDPIYSGKENPLPNATKDTPEGSVLSTKIKVSDIAIKIDNVLHHLSFNNIILCETKENLFISCVEICKDHCLGVGKTNLFNFYSDLFSKSKELKSQQSTTFSVNQVVISDSTSLISESCVSDRVTHADPRFLKCPESYITIENSEQLVEKVKFGTSFYIRPKEPFSLSNVYNEVFQHFLLSNKESVIPLLDQMKERKDFNINSKDKSGYTPIVLALLQKDVNVMKKLVTEFQADCKPAFEFCLKRKNILLFQIGLQISEFRNIVDLHLLAQPGLKAMLCEAMAAGVEYKEDISKLETLEPEESRDLILLFIKVKDLAKSMTPFEVGNATKEEALKKLFLGNPSPTLFAPALSDKEERILNGLLGPKPELIIKDTIKRELMEQEPDKAFLQKLFYLQHNLPQIHSSVINDISKNSPI